MIVKRVHNQGNHLIFDGYSDDSKNLNNKEFIRSFIVKLVSVINMTSISKPFVFHYDAKEKSESGVTGTIILAESNITIHTYPSRNWFALDVFSCNEFDIDKTVSFIIDTLKVKNYEKQILKRGIYNETDKTSKN